MYKLSSVNNQLNMSKDVVIIMYNTDDIRL